MYSRQLQFLGTNKLKSIPFEHKENEQLSKCVQWYMQVVLGPAVDGGYYLIGVKGPRVEPHLFEVSSLESI